MFCPVLFLGGTGEDCSLLYCFWVEEERTVLYCTVSGCRDEDGSVLYCSRVVAEDYSVLYYNVATGK